MQVQKPKHNKFDNIWEIRQTGYPSEELFLEATKQVQVIDISTRDVAQIGGALIFHDVRKFIHSILQKHGVKIPIWKIVIPQLERDNGAIYYIAECKDYNRIFRGTYGYGGTGPHESALVEACFEKFGLCFEVRNGDYLINFLYPKEA